MKIAWSLGVWVFYAAILLARHLGRTAPRRIATLCVLAFSAALTLLWGITFLSPDGLALMNLFCVGLSHHTANVETRERFVGHAAIDRMLRESLGCSEAILLTTCNRRRSLRRF